MSLGVLAQILAVHLRLPGIVLLLAVGVLMGPDFANIIRPETLGSGLPAFVGFAVAIILFEGGLQMNIKRLARQAKPIRRLVTVGAIITAVLATAVAYFVMPGWPLQLCILFGTLVIVTGPTVITPLVRRLRIRHDVSMILEAEGIFIDAVGATIAVVALEAALAWSAESAAMGVFDVIKRIGVGAVVGALCGGFLALLFRWRKVIPHGLNNILALGIAVGTFQLANAIVHESGITAAIVAGMVVGNSKSHLFEEIVEFKEQLTSFFIATLFVLLAADVRIADVIDLGVYGLIVVGLLMFVVRPVTVALSTIGTTLGWKEKMFISWLGPRGIVAAAVASLFAVELAHKHVEGGVQMRALVFLVIAMTVAIQGISGGVLASILGLRRKSNDGYLIFGANKLARMIGKILTKEGESVLLVDSLQDACQSAEKEGLQVLFGNGLEAGVLHRARAESRKACIALTSDESVNFLFAERIRQHYHDVAVYVGLVSEASGVTAEMVHEKECHVLFGGERSLPLWERAAGQKSHHEETWQRNNSKGEINFGTAPTSALLPLCVTGGKAELIKSCMTIKKGHKLHVLVRVDQEKLAHEWLQGAGFEALGADGKPKSKKVDIDEEEPH